MTSMEIEFTEEEVVENPTLKAAYNLAPLHQNQPLRWDYEVDLIGNKVCNKVLHLCESCELPILVYGRMLPCKHIFCFTCARACDTDCKRCLTKLQKVEELALGTVYICTHGAPKHSTKGCRKAYLSQRDLQSHIAHRHMPKPISEAKTSSSTQPQLPLTQQQAAAVQHVSQAATTQHSQPSLLPSSSHNPSPQQQVLSTSSPFISNLREHHHQQQQHHHQQQQQPLAHDAGQHLLVPGHGDMRTGSTSTSPAMSQTPPDPKSNSIMPHGMVYNPSPQTNESGNYRPLDIPALPHHIQQQQQHHLQQLQHPHQPLQHQQQHLQLPLSQAHTQQQQPPPPQIIQHSSSPGMPPMSKPLLRFGHQSPQNNPMSSSMSLQSSHINPYQMTASNSPSEMRTSTHQMHHQQPRQNVSLHQQQQQQQHQMSGMIHPHGGHQSQLHMQKNYDEMQSELDMDDYERIPKMDNFGNPVQKLDTFNNIQNVDNNNMRGGMPSMDNYNNVQQQQHRKSFNHMQDMDDYSSMKKMDNFNSPHKIDNFNTIQSGMLDPSGAPPPPPNPQGGPPSRNKNVNLITVPIQDEGQFRPLPYVSQSQLPLGGASAVAHKNYPPFSTSMSTTSNNPPTNFSPMMNNQTIGGASLRPSHRMPYSRPGNPQSHPSHSDSPQAHLPLSGNPQQQTRLSQPGNLGSTNLMLNNPRGVVGAGGGNRLPLGGSMPPNVRGALAGAVHALTRSKGGVGGPGGQGVMMPTPSGSLHTPHNPRFNAPPSSGHWPTGGSGGGSGGNLRPIQPRMTQNMPPRVKGDSHYKQQGYYR